MDTAPDRVVAPSREDPVVASASEVIGGPLGRYAVAAARGWRWYAAVLAGASAVPMALGVAARAYCIDNGWSTPDQFWHACFSDLPATYANQGLQAGLVPLLTGAADSPTPAQPPVTAAVMSLLGSAVRSGTPADQQRFYFALWAVLGAVLVAVTVWWTAATTRRFPLRAAHLALSPVVALTVLVAPDVLGVALTAAALYAWSRRRTVLVGILLGLAISARTYPVVVLLAIFLVAARSGQLRVFARTAAAAGGTFAVVLGGFLLANPDAAVRAYITWLQAGAGFGSPWVLPQLAGYPLPGGVVTVVAVLGWVAALGAGAVFALGLDRRPGVAEVSLVMLAVVMVTGKSMPVQSSLWLVPLVALVGIRWKDHLLWASAEAMHFVAVWLYLAGTVAPDQPPAAGQPTAAERSLPAGWYALFLFLRVAAVLWLVHRTWSVAAERRPRYLDPGDVGDPATETDEVAGPLAGSPDALVVRFT